MLTEPGHYSQKKLSEAQIMQDAAGGTRSMKLSTGRRATILNAVRIVNKEEINSLYTSACDKEGNTKEKRYPSKRTLWNILNKYTASQRKSLAGLDLALKTDMLLMS